MSESTDQPSNDLPSEDLPKARLGAMAPLGIQRPLMPARPLGLHTQWIQPKFIYPLGAISIANPNSLQLAEDFDLLNTSFREVPIADPPAVSPQTESSVPNPVVTPSTETIQRDAIDDAQPTIQAKAEPSATSSSGITPELMQIMRANKALSSQRSSATESPSNNPSNSDDSPQSSTTQQPKISESINAAAVPIQAKTESSTTSSSGITPELMQIMRENRALSSNRESAANPPSKTDSPQSSTSPQPEISQSVNAAEVPIQAKAESSTTSSSGITPELMQIMRENKALSSNRESAANPPSKTDSPQLSTSPQSEIGKNVNAAEVPIQAKAESSTTSSSGITPELMQIMRENRALSSNRESAANPPSKTDSPQSSTSPQPEISQSVNAAEVPIQAKAESSTTSSSGITPELMQIMRENKALSSNRESAANPPSKTDSPQLSTSPQSEIGKNVNAAEVPIQAKAESSTTSSSGITPELMQIMRENKALSSNRDSTQKKTSEVDSSATADSSSATSVQMKAAIPDAVQAQPLSSDASISSTISQNEGLVQRSQDAPIDRSPNTPTPSNIPVESTDSLPSALSTTPSITPLQKKPDSLSSTKSKTTSIPSSSQVNPPTTNSPVTKPQTTSPSSQSVDSTVFTPKASSQDISKPSTPIQRQAEVSANSSTADSAPSISDSQNIAPQVSDRPAIPSEINVVTSSEPLQKAIDTPPSQTSSPTAKIQRKVEAPPTSSASISTPPQTEASGTTNIPKKISESIPLPSLQLKPNATDVVQTESTSIPQDTPTSTQPIQRKPEATTSSPTSTPQTDLDTNLSSTVVTSPSSSVPVAKDISSPPVSNSPTTLQRNSEATGSPVTQTPQSNVEPTFNSETPTPEISNTVASIQPSRDRVVSQAINPATVQKTTSDSVSPIQSGSETPIQAKPATDSDPSVSEPLSDLGNTDAIATNQIPAQPTSNAQTPIQKQSETKSTPSLGAAIAKTVWDGLTSLFQSPQSQSQDSQSPQSQAFQQDTTAPLQRKPNSSSASSSTPIPKVPITPATPATNDASLPEQKAAPINPQTTVDNQSTSSLPSQVQRQVNASGSSEPIISNKTETVSATESLGIQRKASSQPTQPIASQPSNSPANDSPHQEFSNTPVSNLLAPLQKQNEIEISRKSEDLGIQRKALSQPTNITQTPSPTVNEISSSESSSPDTPPIVQKQAEPSEPDTDFNVSDPSPIIQKQVDSNVSATESVELIAPISESIGIQRQEVDVSQLSSPSVNEPYSNQGIGSTTSEPASIQRQIEFGESNAIENNSNFNQVVDSRPPEPTSIATSIQRQIESNESTADKTETASSTENIDIQRKSLTTQVSQPQSSISQPISPTAIDQGTNIAQTQNLFSDSLPSQSLDFSTPEPASIQRQVESRESNSAQNDSRSNLPIDSSTPEPTSIQRQIESNQSTVNEPATVSVSESIDIQEKSLTQAAQSQSNIAQPKSPATLKSSESTSSESTSSESTSSESISSESISSESESSRTSIDRTPENISIQRQTTSQAANISQTPSPVAAEASSNQPSDPSIAPSTSDVSPTIQTQANPTSLPTTEGIEIVSISESEDTGIQRQASELVADISQSQSLLTNDSLSNQFVDSSTPEPTSIQRQAESSEAIAVETGISRDTGSIDIQRKNLAQSAQLQSDVSQPTNLTTIESSQLSPQEFSSDRDTENVTDNTDKSGSIQRKISEQTTNFAQTPSLIVNETSSNESSFPVPDISDVTPVIQKQAEPSVSVPEGMEIASDREGADIQRQTSDPIISRPLSSTANDSRDRQAIAPLAPEPISIQRQVELNETIARKTDEIPANIESINAQRKESTQPTPSLLNQSNTSQSPNLAFSDSVRTEYSDSIIPNVPTSIQQQTESSSSIPEAVKISGDTEVTDIQRQTSDPVMDISQLSSTANDSRDRQAIDSITPEPTSIQRQIKSNEAKSEIPSSTKSTDIQRKTLTQPTPPPQSNISSNISQSTNLAATQSSEPSAQGISSDPDNISIQRKTSAQPTNIAHIPTPVVEALNQESLSDASLEIQTQAETSLSAIEGIEIASNSDTSSESATQGHNLENISIQRKASELPTNTSQPTNQTAIPSHEPTLGISDIPPVIQKQSEPSLSGIGDIEIASNTAGNTEDTGIQRQILDRLTEIPESPSLATNDSLGTQSVDLSIPEQSMQRQSESSDVPTAIQRQAESNIKSNVDSSESTTREFVGDRDFAQGIDIQRTPAAEAIAVSQSPSLEVSDSVRNDSLDSTTSNSIPSTQSQVESTQADRVSIQRESISQPVESPSSSIPAPSNLETDRFSSTTESTVLPTLQREAEVSRIEAKQSDNVSILEDSSSLLQRKVESSDRIINRDRVSTENFNIENFVESSPQPDIQREASEQSANRSPAVAGTNEQSEMPTSQPVTDPESSDLEIPLQLKSEPSESRSSLSSELPTPDNDEVAAPSFPLLPTVLDTISRSSPLGRTSDALGNTPSPIGSQTANGILSQTADPTALQAKFNAPLEYPFDLAPPIQQSADKRSPFNPSTSSPESKRSSLPSTIQRMLAPESDNSTSDDRNDGALNLPEPTATVPDTWSSLADLVGSVSSSPVSSSTIDASQASVSQASTAPINSVPIVQRQSDSGSSTSAWSSIQELISDRKTTNTRSSLAPPSQVQEPVIQRFGDSAEVGVSYGNRDNANEEADISTNLEILAQEIYVLLRQRLEIERERHGSGYYGQLPW